MNWRGCELDVGTRQLLEKTFTETREVYVLACRSFRGSRADDVFLVRVGKLGLRAELVSLLGVKKTDAYLNAIVSKGSLGARLFEEEVLSGA